MRLLIEFDLEIADSIRTFKRWFKDQICKRKGHIWKKYEEPKGYFLPFYANFLQDQMFEQGKITHECKRCGNYQRDPYVPEDKPLKIKRYSKLSSVEKTFKKK